jgi:hypothetical protein
MAAMGIQTQPPSFLEFTQFTITADSRASSRLSVTVALRVKSLGRERAYALPQ